MLQQYSNRSVAVSSAPACRYPFVVPLSQGEAWEPYELWDTVLYETEHHVVVPTRGSMLPGWLLVVPKRVCLSFAQSNDDQWSDLEQITKTLSNHLHSITGQPTVIWENGAYTTSSSIGCGVDQAHLHILPLDISLRDTASLLLDNIEWISITEHKEVSPYWNKNGSYLFIQEACGGRYAAYSPDVPGQFMRRVIARSIDRPLQFDWNEYDGLANIELTISMLKKHPFT